MGVDRLYVQPARTQHQELVPHWGSAQPHRIHRTTHTAPGVIQTRGREWRHPQGQLWGSDQLSPMPGWLSRCPAIFSSMQGSPAYRGICVHQAPRLVGGQVDCPSKNSPSQFTEHVHRRAPLESLSSGTGRTRVTDFLCCRWGSRGTKTGSGCSRLIRSPRALPGSGAGSAATRAIPRLHLGATRVVPWTLPALLRWPPFSSMLAEGCPGGRAAAGALGHITATQCSLPGSVLPACPFPCPEMPSQ